MCHSPSHIKAPAGHSSVYNVGFRKLSLFSAVMGIKARTLLHARQALNHCVIYYPVSIVRQGLRVWPRLALNLW